MSGPAEVWSKKSAAVYQSGLVNCAAKKLLVAFDE
jgi:hypothetical protein